MMSFIFTREDADSLTLGPVNPAGRIRAVKTGAAAPMPPFGRTFPLTCSLLELLAEQYHHRNSFSWKIQAATTLPPISAGSWPITRSM